MESEFRFARVGMIPYYNIIPMQTSFDVLDNTESRISPSHMSYAICTRIHLPSD